MPDITRFAIPSLSHLELCHSCSCLHIPCTDLILFLLNLWRLHKNFRTADGFIILNWLVNKNISVISLFTWSMGCYMIVCEWCCQLLIHFSLTLNFFPVAFFCTFNLFELESSMEKSYISHTHYWLQVACSRSWVKQKVKNIISPWCLKYVSCELH